MAIKTLRVFAEYTSTGFVPMPTAGGIDYGYTLANTFPSTTPSSFQTDDPDIDVTVTAMTDFYVWIRISGTAWNPSYTRNVRVYPDSPDINNVVMNMIIATGPAGTSAYSQIVQTSNRLYFNGATTDSVYNSKFAGKTYINELNFGTAPQLATVATSGAYADLTGKPALSTVATSGSYADLSNKPSGTAPISYNSGTNSFQISVASASTNGYLTSTDWSTFNAKYLLPSGGTTAQYLRGDGTLATFPTTLDSTRLIFSGRNNTGTTLTKGTVVYINGVSGNTALLARAIASADSTSAQTLGVVEFDIANNATGVVVLVGAVNNLDTSSFTEGVQLYLSGTVAGAFTSSKVLAPTHLVYVGIVTRAHPTLGTIEVKIQNGYELDEIHDVQISSPANKDILYHDTASSLWKHASIASVLGYTPYNATNPNNYIALTALSASAPLSYNNTTGAFSITQANTTTNGFLSSTDWNTFNSKQSALTLGNVSEVSSNVLMFPDGGTGKTIGNLTIQVVQASASTNGYLSSTDWNTFNNKQNAITLTTTGTSGAATLSGATLNIPQYQTALTNPVTGTGTSGHVAYWGSSSSITGESSLFYDATNDRLGIGTSSPYGQFTIGNISNNVGGLNFAESSNSASRRWQIRNDTDVFGDLGIRQSTTQTGSTYVNRLYISPVGNIGIGVTPSAWASGTENSLQIKTASIYGYDNYEGGFSINAYYNDGWKYISNAVATQIKLSSGNIEFNNSSSGTAGNAITFTRAMTLTSAGNLGIGTTSPSGKLHLIGGSSGADLLFLNTSGANTNFAFKITGAASDYLTIRRNHPTAGNLDIMSFTYGGNVGIGTTSPSTELHVVGSGKFTASAQIHKDGSDAVGSGPYFALVQTSNAKQWLMQMNGAQGLAFWAYTGSAWTTPVTFTNAGNVGIGTTSPGVKLEVYDTGSSMTNNPGNSQIRASASSTQWLSLGYDASVNAGYIQAAQSGVAWRSLVLNRMGGNILLGTQTDNGSKLYVGGTIYAEGNITANSDLTLKKNLKIVENSIDKINQLNGYLYQWKTNDEYQYGVIAQEVENILPHAVFTGTNGIKGVSYNQIIPILIEAVKELNKKLEAK